MVANETIKRKGLRKLKLLVAVMLCMCLLLTGCTDQQVEEAVNVAFDILLEALDDSETETNGETQETEVPVNVEGKMTVHFIDVG